MRASANELPKKIGYLNDPSTGLLSRKEDNNLRSTNTRAAASQITAPFPQHPASRRARCPARAPASAEGNGAPFAQAKKSPLKAKRPQTQDRTTCLRARSSPRRWRSRWAASTATTCPCPRRPRSRRRSRRTAVGSPRACRARRPRRPCRRPRCPAGATRRRNNFSVPTARRSTRAHRRAPRRIPYDGSYALATD